jgi:hypothetical protein
MNFTDFCVACKWFDSFGKAFSLLNVTCEDTHFVRGGQWKILVFGILNVLHIMKARTSSFLPVYTFLAYIDEW